MHERDLYREYQELAPIQMRRASYVASKTTQLIKDTKKAFDPENVPLGIVIMCSDLTKDDYRFIQNIWNQLRPPDKITREDIFNKKWTGEQFEKNGTRSGYAHYTLFNWGMDYLYEDLDFYKKISSNPDLRAEKLSHFGHIREALAGEIGFLGIMDLPNTDPLRITALNIARKNLVKDQERVDDYSSDQIEEFIHKRLNAHFDHKIEDFSKYDSEISLILGGAESRLKGFDLGVENYRFVLSQYLESIS